jgi:hypothetical protein
MNIWTSKPFLFALGIVVAFIGVMYLASPASSQETEIVCYTQEMVFDLNNEVAPYVDSLTPEEVGIVNSIYGGNFSHIDLYKLPLFDDVGDAIPNEFDETALFVVYFEDGCAVWAEGVLKETITEITGHVFN